MVTNGGESSFELEVRAKQEQDPILLELNANIHKKRVLTFEQGELCIKVSRYNVCSHVGWTSREDHGGSS